MQENLIVHIASNVNYIRLKTRFNLRFFGLTALLFLLQPFSFASFQTSLGFKKIDSAYTYAFFTENIPVDHHQNIDLFIEVETAEEDEVKHAPDQTCSLKGNLITLKERYYTSFVNIRYLQLAQSKHHKTEPPFFILYHSWKSDIF